MALNLRPWQESAINKCLKWFDSNQDNKFLVNAAPGAGKTICASVIALELIKKNKIERVIVIAPRKEVVKQWAEEFFSVTGRKMMKFTGEIEDDEFDICATWNSIENMLDGFQHVCNKYKTLIICDEHHHAAISAVWGESANDAFKKATFKIILTGTPIRTDGKAPVWFSYSKASGELKHDQDGTYTLTYGEAVDYGYCRPIFFHRHEGNFRVVIDNETLAVSGKKGVDVDEKKHPKKLVKSLQQSLDFYTLARKPIYKKDGITPDLNSYQSTMLQWGIEKLEKVRERTPHAGGLVIAPSIKVAEYMSKLLEKLTGEKPILVHSEHTNAEDKIDAFRHSKKQWLVSVAMISEGVDIKRLRILVYLPNPQTELSFRQAMGRVVRSLGDDDFSRAYVVMPAFKIFEEYARRVESEMKPTHLNDPEENKNKICPSCESEVKKDQNVCPECSYEFPVKKTTFKTCDKCEKLNPVTAKECQFCGEKFHLEYTLNLESALREGGIARELDIDEEDVQLAEKNFENLRKDILEGGDAKMIALLKRLPEETWAKISKYGSKYFKED